MSSSGHETVVPANSANHASTAPSDTSVFFGLSRLLFGDLGPVFALIGVIALFAVLDSVQKGNDTFLTVGNTRMLLVQTVTVAVAALGMTMIILSGGIDLSVGTSIALSSVVLALGLTQGWNPILAIIACIVTGVFLGILNGALISLLRIPPFIATLGTMTAYLGVAKILASETTVRPKVEQVPVWLGGLVSQTPPWAKGRSPTWLQSLPDLFFNHPYGVWIAAVLAIVTIVILRYTVLGRHIFALGSNEPTARLCGIPIAKTRILIYALAGLFVGVAGVFQFARLNAGSPKDGVGMELKIIAAVVIGGASLSGGRGTVLGTLTGAAIMNVIASGCTTLKLSNSIQDIVIGSIIVGAVTLDQWRQRRLGE